MGKKFSRLLWLHDLIWFWLLSEMKSYNVRYWRSHGAQRCDNHIHPSIHPSIFICSAEGKKHRGAKRFLLTTFADGSGLTPLRNFTPEVAKVAIARAPIYWLFTICSPRNYQLTDLNATVKYMHVEKLQLCLTLNEILITRIMVFYSTWSMLDRLLVFV